MDVEVVVVDVEGPVILNLCRKYCTRCKQNVDVKDADVVRVMQQAVRYATNGAGKALWHTVGAQMGRIRSRAPLCSLSS